MSTLIRSRITATVTLAAAVFVGACAHVGQEQYDSDLASIRQQMDEMETGNSSERAEIVALEQRMDRMDAQMDGLAQSLEGLQSEFDVTVERLEMAVRFNVPVYFEFDESMLRAQDLAILDRFSSVVREYYPDALLTVEGFTDPIGNEEYNRALGLRRAESVRDHLVERGSLSMEHIRVVSYGEATNRQVVEGEGGEEHGWENRRVALVVEHNEAMMPMEIMTPEAGGR